MISVLIPVYNTAAYLRECLESVVSQTYRELDIVLMDDGSTDGSGDICDEYARGDPRVRVIHQPNGGVAAARNALLREVRGEYIAWVDSDDVCMPEMLAYLYSELRERGADLTQCRRTSRPLADGGDEGQAETLSSREEMYLALGPNRLQAALTGKLFRAEVLAGLSFPELSIGEDAYIMFMAARRMNTAVLLPAVLYYYRLRRDSLFHSAPLACCLSGYNTLLELRELPKPVYLRLLYAQANAAAGTLARSPGEYALNRRGMDGLTRALRRQLGPLLSGGFLGSLGKLEVLALCTGRPWSWRFSVRCQKIYEIRAERKQST